MRLELRHVKNIPATNLAVDISKLVGNGSAFVHQQESLMERGEIIAII